MSLDRDDLAVVPTCAGGLVACCTVEIGGSISKSQMRYCYVSYVLFSAELEGAFLPEHAVFVSVSISAMQA